MGLLSGSTIAFPNRSVDHSLYIRSILRYQELYRARYSLA